MSSSISTPIFHQSQIGNSSDSFEILQSNISCDNFTESISHQQLVLAVAWVGGKLGAAYYDIVTHELWIVPDIADGTGSTSVLNGLFFQLRPHTLIIKQNQDENRMANIYRLTGVSNLEASSSKISGEVTNEEVLEDFDSCSKIAQPTTTTSTFSKPAEPLNPNQFFKNSSTSDDQSINTKTSNEKKKCHLYIVPSSFYNAKAASRRLKALRLETIPSSMTNTEYLMHLKSIFPFDCPALLQATGGLLKMLEQWKTGQDVDHLLEATANSMGMKIFSIRTHRVEDSLWMDQSTFFSLNIFSEESHPSAFKKGHQQSAKEGFSLYGMASRCHSTAGSVCLKNLFLRPVRNVKTLEERYSVIEFCKSVSNVEVVRNLTSLLKRISDIKVPLLNISTMQSSLTNWKKVLVTARNLIALSERCKNLPQNIALFKQLSDEKPTRKWQSIVDIIYRLINFEESKRIGRCVVNFGVDDDLDQLKREYNNVQHIYTESAYSEMENLPSYIEQGVIEFFPSLGHCLCLRSWLPVDQPIIPDQITIPGIELKFFTSENLYFKSGRCYELDNEFGDFAAKVLAHEMSVMFAASKAVIEQSTSIIAGVELAGYLDALLSLSSLSSEFEMVKPKLIENGNGIINISKGRHILLQLVSEQFNPNSTVLGGEVEGAMRINIISGPNSSGKSVYLKQTALIVYLAQIGCFVPAERVALTPFEHLFVVGHPPETLVTSLSYFGVELSLMSVAAREATNRSLIIVDEFGTGSHEADGSALFISCMEHWIQRNDRSPLVLVATHLHTAVAHLSRFSSTLIVQFSSMGYILQEGQLIFTYQLKDEVCMNSFPLSIAHAAGLPDEIVERARQVLEALDNLNLGSLTLNSLIRNDATNVCFREISETFARTDLSCPNKAKQFLKRTTRRYSKQISCQIEQ